MKNSLPFSVSMCVYGGDNPEHFSDALCSVFNQTVSPDEVILVVDGPISKDTNSVIEAFSSKYSQLEVIRLSENQGHGIARSIGLEHCSNTIVAIADADDINAQTRFEEEIKEFKANEKLSIVGSNVEFFVDSLDNIVTASVFPSDHNEICTYIKKNCPFAQPSVMFNKEHIIAAGGYVDWFQCEDYYLWIRVFENNGIFKNIDKTLVYMRTSEEQSQRRGGYEYYKSLRDLYKYMKRRGIINLLQYILNVLPRFILQVVMPNKMRYMVRNILMKF